MSCSPPYHIIIAEDQLIVAEALSVLLQQDSDFKVMAIAENGEKLLQLLNEKLPHLILLDLNMPIVDGIEACQQVRQKFPGIVVVALTSYDDNKVRHRVKAAGAAGMFIGPLYPLSLSYLLELSPWGWFFAVGGMGAALFPWLTGVVSAHFHSLRYGLMVPCVTGVAMAALNWRIFRGRQTADTTLTVSS